MSKVKFSDVVVRANTKEDRYNTDLEFYVGGEHIDSDEVLIEKRGLIAGSTIGPMFYFGFKAGQVLFVSRNPHLTDRRSSVAVPILFGFDKSVCRLVPWAKSPLVVPGRMSSRPTIYPSKYNVYVSCLLDLWFVCLQR